MKGSQRFMRRLHAAERAALASGMALLVGCASLQGTPPAPSTLPPLDGARQFRAVTCGENADGRQSLVVAQPWGRLPGAGCSWMRSAHPAHGRSSRMGSGAMTVSCPPIRPPVCCLQD